MKTTKLTSTSCLYNERTDPIYELKFSQYRSLSKLDIVIPRYTTRFYRSGNGVRANELIGKVVRGYSVTAEVECLGRPSSGGASKALIGFSYSLFKGTPAKEFAAIVYINPDKTVDTVLKTGEGEIQPYRGYRTSYPGVTGSVPALHVRVSAAKSAASIPLFRVTREDCLVSDNAETWFGPRMLSYSGIEASPIIMAALKFDVAYSDPPVWSAINTGWAAVGVSPRVPTISVTARYPDADKDPVVGLSITATTSGKYATVSADGKKFGPVAVAITDATGSAGFYVRGQAPGDATIDVRATDANVRSLFDPPMAATATVQVTGADGDVGGGGDPPSDDPPIGVVPGPGSPPVQNPETGCIVYPVQPYVPAVPARFDVTTSMDWDAGANSVDELDGDVRLVFDCKKVVGVVIGLVAERGDVTDYARMSHAFHFYQTPGGQPQVVVMEFGRAIGTPTPYAPDVTTFEILRVGGAVSYRIDGEVTQQSRVPSAGVVMAGCSVYATDDTVPGSAGGGG